MALTTPGSFKTFHHDVYPAIDPTKEELSARGKLIVITGGGSGIGPSIAEAFAKAKADKIALLGRTERTLLSTKQSLEAQYSTQITTHVVDVSQEAAVKKAFEEIAKLGPIDVLVSNAGYLPDKHSIVDSDLKDWWTGYEVNVKAALLLTRALVKNAAKDAVLINISAGLAHYPPARGLSGYASSKLASAKLYEYVQFEHPELRVVNIHPGIIPTEMAKKGTDGEKASSDWMADTRKPST
jgi:NAD(P)-dependent dehydrogenase (short-subunit alcohol dehydrogenase family)